MNAPYNPALSPRETEIATQLKKATDVLNAFRWGSMILPVAGLAAAAAVGPVAVWIAGAATGLSVLGTRLASRYQSSEIQRKIAELRSENTISESDADQLDVLARRMIHGSQPTVERDSVASNAVL